MRTNPYRNITGNATAQLVQAGVTDLHYVDCANKTTDDVWLHLYDSATAGGVTVGTTTPKQSYLIPLGDGTNYTLRERQIPGDPIHFALGLVWAVTKEVDAGATAPTTNTIVNMNYTSG